MVTSRKAAGLSRIYAWFDAVNTSDTDLLGDLFFHGIPIDVPHPLRHSTALMEATRRGRADTVQWLLEHGAAPAFLCGHPKGTALHCALRHRYWEIAGILSHAMQSCAVIDANGATPLHMLCAEYSHAEQDTAIALAALFIAKQCPLDALDREGTTALHYCTMNDARSLALLLLDYGCNPNALIPDSRVSPLTIAALEKNIEMARLLLQYGANPEMKTREGSTALSIYAPIAQLVSPATQKREPTRKFDMRVLLANG